MNTCNDARPLVMSYLDGELSEAQAAPLRKHLLECQPCRGSAQDQKNLKRWFQAGEPVVIPKDFAARVARRAFQGDRGEVPAPVAVLPSRADEGRTLRFVLGLTALAAGLVLCFAVAVRGLALPGGDGLSADDKNGPPPIEKTIRELRELNARDGRGPVTTSTFAPQSDGTAKPVSTTPADSAAGARKP